MKKRFSVLFVCMGNTCRSPLAEVILKSELKKAGIANVNVSSAGTGAFEGGSASPGAIAAARQMGLSLSRSKSKPLSQRRVRRADLILTMARAQKQEIANRWPEANDKTYALSEFTKSGGGDVQDPMGKPLQAYIESAETLRKEMKYVVARIKRLVKRQRPEGVRGS